MGNPCATVPGNYTNTSPCPPVSHSPPSGSWEGHLCVGMADPERQGWGGLEEGQMHLSGRPAGGLGGRAVVASPDSQAHSALSSVLALSSSHPTSFQGAGSVLGELSLCSLLSIPPSALWAPERPGCLGHRECGGEGLVLRPVCVSLWARRREGTRGHVVMVAPVPDTEVPAGQAVERASGGVTKSVCALSA